MKPSNILVILTIFCMCCVLCLAKNSPKMYLDGHNKARAEVGVKPLKWNETLASYAKKYAESHSGLCVKEHSGGPYGENHAAYAHPKTNATSVVEDWLAEKKNYNYTTNSCHLGENCGNYLQMVWHDTAYLGCASVKCKSGWLFFVCCYDPPGNLKGLLPY